MKHARLPCLLVVCALLAAFAACPRLLAQDAAPGAPEREVLAAENDRFDAILHRDIPRLTTLLTEDVSYVHAEGYMESNRKDYLARVAAGKVTYTSYHIDNSFVKIYGDVAVTHGIFGYQIVTPAKTVNGTLLYTGVYRHEAGIWKLLAWHTTRKAP